MNLLNIIAVSGGTVGIASLPIAVWAYRGVRRDAAVAETYANRAEAYAERARVGDASTRSRISIEENRAGREADRATAYADRAEAAWGKIEKIRYPENATGHDDR